MAANGISELATKQLKQVAKLALAATDRAADGRPSTLNINELPTKYSGDDIVENSHPGGLVEGRPWS
jgi:hypothetical protein